MNSDFHTDCGNLKKEIFKSVIEPIGNKGIIYINLTIKILSKLKQNLSVIICTIIFSVTALLAALSIVWSF